MQDKNVKSTKGNVLFASILIAISMIGELYGLLNFSDGILMYVLLAGCAVILIISLSMFVNGIYKEQNLKNEQMREYMDNVLKSEKASYLMMKKNFEQMENQLTGFQNSSDVPVEDIINAQKGVAKVIINRNKENADALMNSNDQLMEQIAEFEAALRNNNEILLANREIIQALPQELTPPPVEESTSPADTGNDKEVMMKLQEFMTAMKDMELRLNTAILQTQQSISNQPVQLTAKVDIAAPAMGAIPMPAVQPVVQPVAVAPGIVEQQSAPTPVIEEKHPIVAESVSVEAQQVETESPAIEEQQSVVAESVSVEAQQPVVEDPFGVEAQQVETESPEIQEKPVDPISIMEETEVIDESGLEEQKPPMPDLSDPNKELSDDEISALLANIGVEDDTVSSAAEATSDFGLDNISLDNISLDDSGDISEIAEIQMEEAEVIAGPEEPAMSDLSDPNKKMSDDDIAALLASMNVGDEPATPTTEAQDDLALDDSMMDDISLDSISSGDISIDDVVLDDFAQEPIDEIEDISGISDINIEESEVALELEVIPEPEPEKLAMPDLSDPNKKMSDDEIAALIANMGGDSAPELEPEPEKPAMPDLSDPNKQLSPDEIAALFANMGGDSTPEPEPEPEPEKPAMPDLSDPNRQLSPDEIAALFANL